MTHSERVQLIQERFNAILSAHFRLDPVEFYADGRNVYRRTTELAYRVGEREFAFSVEDTLVEGDRNILDCHLGEFIARNLKDLK